LQPPSDAVGTLVTTARASSGRANRLNTTEQQVRVTQAHD
jgi:hypothetical protein